ncbi:MAG: hypothetical protein K6G89_07245 [Clostridia bacterium]|nr:hypothetical protein [Clostridia bacterium]
MKKMLTFILILAMMLSMLPAGNIVSFGDTAPHYELTAGKASPGGTVELTISIANNPGVISLRNSVTFNMDIFTLESVEDLGLLNGFTTPAPKKVSPYTLRWADALATENNFANGDLIKVTFTVNENAAPGKYAVTAAHLEARNAGGEKIYFTAATTEIEILKPLKGDADGDGEITDWDAIIFNRYLAGWEVEIDLSGLDIDGDGEVTDWDAIILSRYLAGWQIELNPEETPVPTPEYTEEYANTANYKNTYSIGIDDLDRKLYTSEAPAMRENRQVGIFYFLWIGYHSSTLYDNSVIVANDPNAIKSVDNWIAAGGGGEQAFHFWGKPMFGYYPSNEKWVMRKHVQMLTDAGIDFLCFDATNAYTYSSNALSLMKVLEEYRVQGWRVPKVCFYTNSSSGKTINAIYNEIYKAHPEYQNLWYYWDGKPMIVGVAADSDLSAEAKNFFRIKASVWPNSGRTDDGFPWMEFGRLLTNNAVYGLNGRKEVVNVSVAQHSSTCTFSLTAWYGSNDRTRSWHSGKNEKGADAYLHGYNFAEQFEWALRVDPEMIFITGWNEWIAQRQPPRNSREQIIFVDNASANCSRDIEPMEGGYGDNYYMQMISFIRRYKGLDDAGGSSKRTVDLENGFAQWNDVESYYKDYEGDAVRRANSTFERKVDYTNRNDITEMKVCEDDGNVYFFVKTKADITDPAANDFSQTGWMTLYISTDLDKGWKGANYVVNFEAPSDGRTSIATLANSDTFTPIKSGEVLYRLYEDMLMISIPKSMIGISGKARLGFRWSDNNTWGDVFSFYKNGDSAPIGRNFYTYGYAD